MRITKHKINLHLPGVSRSNFLFFLLFFCFSVNCFAGSAFTFVDMNGDLLADSPGSGKTINPDVLYYSSSPEAEKQNLSLRHTGRMDFIAEKTGKKVVYLETGSSLEEIEKMRDGELHIAGFSTGNVGFAVNLAGFIPFCVKAKGDQLMGYHLQIIVNSNGKYHSLQDLKGLIIAHTSTTSNSGNIAPRALLPKFGLVPDESYQVVYSGSHKKSIKGVADGTYPAAAVASSTLQRMVEAGAINEDNVRVLYTSPKFPTLAMGYAHNLAPALKEQIREAFLEYSFSPELITLYKGATHHLPISYEKDWAIIRHIADYSGYLYTEDGLNKMLHPKGK